MKAAKGLALSIAMCMALACAPLLAGAALNEASPAPAETGQLILDEGSVWRMSASWNRPMVREGAELKECAVPRFADLTAPPPAEWAQPDFADGSWSRWSVGRNRSERYRYGMGEEGAPSPTLSLLCLRGRFAVEDPAKVRKLALSLVYRGGVVVYVNGREVARASLPKDGKIQPRTLARDYPPEAFVHDGPSSPYGGKCLLPRHFKKYRAGVEKRIRRLENVAIDPGVLKKGVNVLAVELHRAPYFGPGLKLESLNHRSVWSTCGLVGLVLRAEGAAQPNTVRPPGIQVWTASDMHRPSLLDYADPLEKPSPVSITGCLNGAFNGRVMISSDKSISGIKARASDLKHKADQGVIPQSAVTLLYTVRGDHLVRRAPRGGFWYPLAEEPPAKVDAVQGGGALQSILLKVRIPADAAPGEYAGTLTVSADDLAATDVPVNLNVVGWKMPGPKDFATHMGAIQSPDSVALQYKAPLWSEEHWKLMEKSYQLLGELGNKTVFLPLITRTNFGNQESLIRWIKKPDGSFTHDFTIFDRYLDLAQKYTKPDVVVLCAFDPWKYQGQLTQRATPGRPVSGAKSSNRVTLLDLATGRVTEMEGPPFSAPEAVGLWKPLLAEAKSRLEKRGLGEAVMLGMLNERRGTKADIETFSTCLPGTPWAVHQHPNCRGRTILGIAQVGYNSYLYTMPYPAPDSGKRYYGWQSKTKTDYWGRGRNQTSPLPLWRASPESVLGLDCAGIGHVGADFWPVLGNEVIKEGFKFTVSVCGRYIETCWDQLNLDRGIEVILAPGPAGAVPTEVFEQLRQGVQECQARIAIEKAILAGTLDAALAKKCRDVLDERSWHIRGLGSTNAGSYGGATNNIWFEGAGSAGLAEKLYAAAAEVAAKTGTK